MREDRISNIVRNMRKVALDNIIISDPSTIFYLSGRFLMGGSRMLIMLINKDGAYNFFMNSLQNDYADISKNIIWYSDSDNPIDVLSRELKGSKKIGIDKDWPSKFLIQLMKKVDSNFVLSSSIIDYIRMIKDKDEIQAMLESCAINQKVVKEMFTYLREGVSELEHGAKLNELYSKYGAEPRHKPPILGYGKSCESPHHRPGDNKLKTGDCIMLDTGTRYKGYMSDMTRTVFYKSCNDKFKEIYKIVYEAHMEALNSVKAGVRFCDIDKIGRNIISKAGYGEYFPHRIGHNIGIDGHEFPDVGPKNEMEILPGMCFSIEPGIYIPEFGGVRIEDLVVATEDGFIPMYDYTKELQIFY